MARSSLYLYPYLPGDIDRFTPRADFAAERDAVDWAWPEGPPPGRTWTLHGYLGVRGVGGVFDPGDPSGDGGDWQAWAILADLSAREFVGAARLASRALDAVEAFNRPRSIAATARAEIPGAARLLKRLGFRLEHTAIDPRAASGVAYHFMVRAA